MLHQAATAPSNNAAKASARQFLVLRQARRSTSNISTNLVDYERQREWLEGLAKYVELSALRAAWNSAEYEPVSTCGLGCGS